MLGVIDRLQIQPLDDRYEEACDKLQFGELLHQQYRFMTVMSAFPVQSTINAHLVLCVIQAPSSVSVTEVPLMSDPSYVLKLFH